MFPDLGKYAAPVMGSYTVTLVLLVAIIALSVMRYRKVKKQLEAQEARRRG